MLLPISLLILNAYISGPAIVTVFCAIDLIVEGIALLYKLAN